MPAVDFDLSPDHELIRRTVREFAEGEVAPVAAELDRTKSFPYEIVAKLGAHSPRTAAMAAAAERRGTRFAGPAVLFSAFLPISGAPVYAAAGWVGLPLIPFMILDAIGCAAWAALLGTAGYLLGPAGVRVADLVSRYALATVGVLVLLAVAPHAWHAWRSRARARCAALRAAAETSLTERADAMATDVRLLPEGADG